MDQRSKTVARYRMADHLCPFGFRSKYLVRRQGFAFESNARFWVTLRSNFRLGGRPVVALAVSGAPAQIRKPAQLVIAAVARKLVTLGNLLHKACQKWFLSAA